MFLSEKANISVLNVLFKLALKGLTSKGCMCYWQPFEHKMTIICILYCFSET